jgi:hypothetical protein
VPHVEPSRLFALSRGELGEAEAQEVRDHLTGCPACAAALEGVVAAQPLFAEPAVPELDEARWRAIDEKVLAAVALEMQKPKGLLDSLRALLDSPIFKPALGLAAVAAAVALFVAFNRPPAPVEQPHPIAAVPSPSPSPEQREVSVMASVDSASDDGAQLAVAGRLAAGAVVNTRRGGETWLRLPDGSRMGVLAASRARLEEISPVEVKVSLEEGALAVSADYAPLRQLEVVAGRLTVRAVGSRFLVMRDAQGSGVAVEEGVVEVGYDGKHETVAAGRTLSFSNDSAGVEDTRLDEADKLHVHEMVTPPAAAIRRPAPRVAMVGIPDASTSVGARLEDGDDDDVPAPAPAPVVNAKISDDTHELLIAEPSAADAGPAQGPTNPCLSLKGLKRASCEWDRSRCAENERSIRRAEEKRSPDGGVTARQEAKYRELLIRRAKCVEKLGPRLGR